MEYDNPASRLGIVSPLCSQPVTSRSMKTVQRSPSRVGVFDPSARRANSPLMLIPEFFRLLLQKRSRTSGARFVHGEVHYHAIVDGDELRILAADLEDRIDRFGAKGFADMQGAGFMRRDLVIDHVCTDELSDQFAARSGGADTAEQRGDCPKAFRLRQDLAVLPRSAGPQCADRFRG